MKRFYVLLLLFAGVPSLAVLAQYRPSGPKGKTNLAYKWGEVAMNCTADDTEKFKPRPTVTSRYLGLVWTAVFDAWSRFDDKAVPVLLRNIKRRPAAEHTLKNKEIAISYAAYRTMMEYFPYDSLQLTAKMKELGFDPDDRSLSTATAAGIGNLAARTVVEQRLFDGSNQTGTSNGPNGLPYSDYTGYRPVNSADSLSDLKHWQPKYFSDGKGGKYAPDCLTPHWYRVKPLLLDSASQFRPVPPPALGSEKLNNEIRQVVEMQAGLTNEQKALVEYMRDGPRSVQQAGHWFLFSQWVSIRDRHTLDDDVKMFFLVEAAAMDAFIACWDAKMFYDFARPYSLVHDYYRDQLIKIWGGPDKNMIQANGQQWRPYSPDTFLCPAFPAYVSGHSTVSGACSEVLRMFTGNDHFGEQVRRVPGALTEPGHLGDTVTLNFPTFTRAADMAGISRVLGGYHIQSDNVEGLKLGRNIAAAIWKKYLKYTGQRN